MEQSLLSIVTFLPLVAAVIMACSLLRGDDGGQHS